MSARHRRANPPNGIACLPWPRRRTTPDRCPAVLDKPRRHPIDIGDSSSSMTSSSPDDPHAHLPRGEVPRATPVLKPISLGEEGGPTAMVFSDGVWYDPGTASQDCTWRPTRATATPPRRRPSVEKRYDVRRHQHVQPTYVLGHRLARPRDKDARRRYSSFVPGAQGQRHRLDQTVYAPRRYHWASRWRRAALRDATRSSKPLPQGVVWSVRTNDPNGRRAAMSRTPTCWTRPLEERGRPLPWSAPTGRPRRDDSRSTAALQP